MATIAFDTLKFARRLRESGVPDRPLPCTAWFRLMTMSALR